MNTLYLINKSEAVSDEDITSYLSFIEWKQNDRILIIIDSQGTFGMDSRAVYITDKTDSIKGYAGATYVYGATTAYDIAGTIDRLGAALGRKVVLLRIWHEVLHHYNQDADGIDKWLADKPLLRFLYHISSPERSLGAWVQEQFYLCLTGQIDEYFDSKNKMDKRTYQGILP